MELSLKRMPSCSGVNWLTFPSRVRYRDKTWTHRKYIAPHCCHNRIHFKMCDVHYWKQKSSRCQFYGSASGCHKYNLRWQEFSIYQELNEIFQKYNINIFKFSKPNNMNTDTQLWNAIAILSVQCSVTDESGQVSIFCPSVGEASCQNTSAWRQTEC